MKFRITRRANPANREEDVYYPSAVNLSTIKTEDIMQEISEACSVTHADVNAVLWAIVKIASHYLAKNCSVRLDPFGSFRATFKTKASKTKEEVSAKNIERVHVVFKPGKAFMKELTSNLRFSRYESK